MQLWVGKAYESNSSRVWCSPTSRLEAEEEVCPSVPDKQEFTLRGLRTSANFPVSKGISPVTIALVLSIIQ